MLEQCAVGPERDSALATPIITDGSLDRVANAPRVVLPDPAAVFADRAARFLQLASGHPMDGSGASARLICRRHTEQRGSRCRRVRGREHRKCAGRKRVTSLSMAMSGITRRMPMLVLRHVYR